MAQFFLIIFYLFGVLAIAAAAIFYFFIARQKTFYNLSRSLNLALFRILLPREAAATGGEKERDPKEMFLAMEQLYVSMMGLRRKGGLAGWFEGRPHMTFEIALPETGKEAQFYAAVPRSHAASFEKQVVSLFPSARVEETEDYNIFRPDGESVASLLSLKKSPLLPLRTYQELGKGSLDLLTGALGKLAAKGEGAAIQLVMRPSANPRNAEGKRAIKRLREGASLSQALMGKSPKKKTPGKKGAAWDPGPPKSVDEEVIRFIEGKAAKAGFDVNIRLVASAETRERAESIAQGLEAAFFQFDHPQANSFAMSRPEGYEREQALYQFSFRLFDEKKNMYLGSEELASLFHLPTEGITTPHVAFLKAKEAEAPPNLSSAGLLLGTNMFRNIATPAYMAREDRQRHFYIVGQTGTGKTTLLLNMVRQDIQAGEGICFIDPHGETAEKILRYVPPGRMRDVIYFNPADTDYPFGLNFLEYDQRFPEQKTFVVNELFSIFQKLYGAIPESMGPAFEQYFRNATMLVIDDPSSGNTLLDVQRVLADKEFRDYKLSRTSNVVVQTFWRQIAEKAGGEASLQNMVPYVTNKFDTFLANEIMRPIIAQQTSSFNFRQVMDEGKILIINLSKGRLGELNSALLGLIIVGKLLMAALSRVEIAEEEKRRDFYLYIDEFQNVTTPSIATILSEARKYRLNLIIAHQFIAQLDEKIKNAVFGNVGTIATFRVGTEDAEFLAKQFEPVFGASDLINIDNRNAYLKMLIAGQTARPFSIKIDPPHAGDPTASSAIKEFSRMTYGRPRAQIEADILRRYTK